MAWQTAGTQDFVLFDGDGGSALLLSNPCGAVQLPREAHPAGFFEAVEAGRAAGRWVALAASYALGERFEPAARACRDHRPLARAWFFDDGRWLAAHEVARFLDQLLAGIAAEQQVTGIADLACTVDSATYGARVEQIRRWIADGDCYQINLTLALDFRLFGDPIALYARLRERQPVRYGACLRIGSETVLSFSPELFFERCGCRVRTRPMKGTVGRGRTDDEDRHRRAALAESAKERAENLMIVDLLRNDLGRLACPGRVRVESLFETEPYPTLWQMVSTVSADLPGVGVGELFAALFPCGSVTGAPRIRAMQRIAEIEGEPRGLYTGSLGWLAPDGDCRFNVAIRTIEVGSGGCARLGVGSGIVADSDPAREYAECLLKARFVTGFDPGFRLFETLRLEDGAYPLLRLHLDRLQGSARSLGFACPLADIQGALAEEARQLGSDVFRVRLDLSYDGHFQVSSSRLMPGPATPRHVVLAGETLSTDDYLLRHKTTARARYDSILASLAGAPEVFDAIFVNTRGEVCEGARSNVFVERGGILLTPPVGCGLLPGVLRRSLLDSGQAREHVLRLDDLQVSSGLFLGNALRGLTPVILDR